VETRQQGSVLFSGILVLIATLVIIQLWLLTAALEALLAHETAVLAPAAIASFVLFLINGGLLVYVESFDRRVRKVEGSRR
jgi:Sec-independent protein secretion pathway component TatC